MTSLGLKRVLGLPTVTFIAIGFIRSSHRYLFLPIQIAALRLPRLYPHPYQQSEFKLKGILLWFCPVVGIAMVVFFGIVIIYELNSPLKIGSFVAFGISGGVYYIMRLKFLKKRGIIFKDIIQKNGIRHV